MTKPVCVPCHRFYRPKKNGFRFIEGMPTPDFDNDGNRRPRAKPGLDEPHRWEPYKVWAGDLWECQGCGHQLVLSASEPLAIRHEERFATYSENATLQVNDC